MNLKELTEKLTEKGKVISKIYEEAGEDLDFSKVKCLEGDTTAKVEALRTLDLEITDLAGQRKELLELADSRKRNQELDAELNKPKAPMTFPGKGAEKPPVKSLGELVMESKAYTDKGTKATINVDTKTLMESTPGGAAGWYPESLRVPRIEMFPLRPIAIIDRIPQLTTDRDTIKYQKETTATQAAAEASQGGTYGEAAFVYTETSDEVEKVGVWLPITDEQIEDVASFPGFINERLVYQLKARIDSQILNGNGATPNLLGTLSMGSLNTQPLGSDARPDAFYKAMTQIRTTGFAEPSDIFINPNDWQQIRLLTTADGVYIFGSPMSPDPNMLWGVPVTVSMAVTEGTGVVGDYRGFSNIYWRRGIDVQITNAHSDFFIKGKQAIRADTRLSMVHYRLDAFCSVTGI